MLPSTRQCQGEQVQYRPLQNTHSVQQQEYATFETNGVMKSGEGGGRNDMEGNGEGVKQDEEEEEEEELLAWCCKL